MKEKTHILLIEDDPSYREVVDDYFTRHPCQYELKVVPVDNLDDAVRQVGEQDFKVVVVDLALPNGEFGTETIDQIWSIDKKVLFIIHSILPVEKIHGWFSDHAMPYTSRFYLQKTGFQETDMRADAARLYELILKAIDCYVPHFEPTIISVKDIINVVEDFWTQNRSFNRSPVTANLHYSQDVINEASRWASDRLSRSGYATTRMCAVLVGSLGRLEGGQYSDADYFLVFDDRGLQADDLNQLINTSYHAFVQLGLWFSKKNIPVHDFNTTNRRPENIDWHTTTLPTWFPLSTFSGKKLGLDTQVELSKLWFLFEGCPIFNKQLFERIHGEVCADLRLFSDRTNRDNVIHSELNAALVLLAQGFNRRKRRRASGEDLIAIKHAFLRDMHILGNQLFLLQCFLDDELYDQAGSYLMSRLRTPPLVKLINFYNFVAKRNTFSSKRSAHYKSLLKNICNSYADGLHKLSYRSVRDADESQLTVKEEREMLNDLLQSSADCEQRIQDIRSSLAADPVLHQHNELKRFWQM
jgi:CheY-like chemotaxis protein